MTPEERKVIEMLQKPEVRDEIIKRLTLRFSLDVLDEIQRIKILYAQAEVEMLKEVYL